MGFPGGSDGKESACTAGDLGLIPGSGTSLGEHQAHGVERVGHNLVTKPPPPN